MDVKYDSDRFVIPNDFIVYNPELGEVELERRVCLLERAMTDLGGIWVGRRPQKVVRDIFRYGEMFYYADWMSPDGQISDHDSTVMQIMRAESLNGEYVEVCSFPWMVPVDYYYEYVRSMFLQPSEEQISVVKSLLGPCAWTLAFSDNYMIGALYEDAYLIDLRVPKIITEVASCYGNPDLALIDKGERFCVVEGGGELIIYFIDTQDTRFFNVPLEGAYYLIQSGSQIRLLLENTPEMEFNVDILSDSKIEDVND